MAADRGSKPATADVLWSCPSCTYDNRVHNQSGKCEICSAPRPSQSTHSASNSKAHTTQAPVSSASTNIHKAQNTKNQQEKEQKAKADSRAPIKQRGGKSKGLVVKPLTSDKQNQKESAASDDNWGKWEHSWDDDNDDDGEGSKDSHTQKQAAQRQPRQRGAPNGKKDKVESKGQTSTTKGRPLIKALPVVDDDNANGSGTEQDDNTDDDVASPLLCFLLLSSMNVCVCVCVCACACVCAGVLRSPLPVTVCSRSVFIRLWRCS